MVTIVVLKWAFQLTKPDRELAKDIVQDAFVQFTVSSGDLIDINNIDNYLFGVVRNTHLSYLRQTSRQQHEPLANNEFDSAASLLLSVDPRGQLKIKDELRAICRYACLRKETSVTSSVLILRFFHGYFPSEVAKLLHSSRNIVDVQLKSARFEARAWLANSDSFEYSERNPLSRVAAIEHFQSAPDLLSELRQEIFATRKGDCLQLGLFYPAGETELTRAVLSHLVSCPRCLDEANRLLGLPVLRERSPIDLGREKRE
ncbi:MAG: sigma-70 family RNA polymerase sigma factor [Pyrinomonadaceae bacterium]|nr:sigma-70 family RNA polymerase sigma factor [Pyrinomonadaceae bacterium]